MRELVNRDNSQKLVGRFKNTRIGFYMIEYAWKKDEQPKRGEFGSPRRTMGEENRIILLESNNYETAGKTMGRRAGAQERTRTSTPCER